MLSASTFAANVTVFGGVNLNQKIESEYQGTTDNYNADKTGYTVGVEAHKEFYKIGNEKVELGVGTKYDSMLKGDVDLDTTTPNEELASTMPVYGSVKLSHQLNKTTSIYLQGKLGYAFAFDGKAIKDVNIEIREYDKNIDFNKRGNPIYSLQQREIAELMKNESGMCIGYYEFNNRLSNDNSFKKILRPINNLICEIKPNSKEFERLKNILEKIILLKKECQNILKGK